MRLSRIGLHRMEKIMHRTYTELIAIPSFEERFRYLQLNGNVGEDTFGFDRWLNQIFYRTPEWRKVRRDAILRDCGCDLAWPEREICGELIIVHHMNPITVEDIKYRSSSLLDLENLITTSDSTHRAITYGDESLVKVIKPIERLPNDTCPWRC